MNVVIKIANTDDEIAQIMKLNYHTFAEEIPQHARNDTKLLSDKFHKNNTYIIALLDTKIVGMISVNSQRPFSLDYKLPDLDSYLPPYRKVCEIRLLAVVRNYRGGRIFYKLMNFLKEYALNEGYDYAVISGTTRQLKLYNAIGFKKFGPLVGTSEALYQPMYLTKELLMNN